MDQNFIKLLLRNKWNENILELKSFIKTFDMPPDEIAIQQKDRIELAKMNLMIDEGKEFSLKKSLSGLEKDRVKRTSLKYNNVHSKTSKALGLTERAVRDMLKK